jgi:hypothetical protein
MTKLIGIAIAICAAMAIQALAISEAIKPKRAEVGSPGHWLVVGEILVDTSSGKTWELHHQEGGWRVEANGPGERRAMKAGDRGV